MRTVIYLSIAGMLTLVDSTAAASERLLFDNSDYDVTVAENYSCGEPVTITVRSGRPELFEADSPELQRIADAAQAVLGFECPEVHAVEIEGRLAGIGDPVYLGSSERRSNWKLRTRQSIQSEQYQEYAAPLVEGDGFGSTGQGLGFNVANLYAGMSVDEARAAVDETFGVEPVYDTGTGVMAMQAGGCPADYDWARLSPRPEPGWKCLQAWFTDQRLARLYLLELVQVVEADTEVVEQRLIERFGEPVHRGSQEHDGGWWRKDLLIRTMAWGEVVESAATAENDEPLNVYNLQAKVMPIRGVTVVTVTLYQPDLRPGWASDKPDSRLPELTL